MGNQTALRRYEEGEIQDVGGIHSDNCRYSLTILDNNLNVGESAGGEE
jgi:hypothetical protein